MDLKIEASDRGFTLPQMIEVESITVKKVGYDHDESLLFIEYHEENAIVVYFDVPYLVAQHLIKSNAVTNYINTKISSFYFQQRIQ